MLSDMIIPGIGILVIVLFVWSIRGIWRTITEGSRLRPDEDEIAEAARAWGSGVGPVFGESGPVIQAGDLLPVLTRTYYGKPGDVEIIRAADGEALARRGYFPSAQTYVEGQWACGDFLMALILCVLLIGVVVFIYMLIVKPAGSLSVTYVRTPSTVPTPTAAFDAVPSSAQGSVRERLAQLDELHGAGVVTDEEYAAKRAKILEDL